MAILKQRRGDDLLFEATFTETGTTTPQDMTGWSIEASIGHDNCTPIQMTAEWVDAGIGQALISMDEAATMNLEVGNNELNIRVTSPEGVSISCPPVSVVVRD